MPKKEEETPLWMDDKNDENHSLKFSKDEESGKEYGATNDDEQKSVVSAITTEENTLLTASGTLVGPRKNIILHVFHVRYVCVLDLRSSTFHHASD